MIPSPAPSAEPNQQGPFTVPAFRANYEAGYALRVYLVTDHNNAIGRLGVRVQYNDTAAVSGRDSIVNFRPSCYTYPDAVDQHYGWETHDLTGSNMLNSDVPLDGTGYLYIAFNDDGGAGTGSVGPGTVYWEWYYDPSMGNGSGSSPGTYVNGSDVRPKMTYKTGSATLADDEFFILVDASGGAVTLTLPAASGRQGKQYVVVKTDSTANAVTIDGNASETISGDTTQVLARITRPCTSSARDNLVHPVVVRGPRAEVRHPADPPATAMDFAMWSGMTLREAREIWRRRQADLVSVDVQGWKAEVLQEDLDRLDGARLEQPVIRLLPYFDTYLLGHRERDHLASAQHRSFIYRPQGWIYPVLLVDGRAAGTWEQIRQGGRLLVQVKKLGPLSRQVRAGIRAEARELGRFLEESQVKVEVV